MEEINNHLDIKVGWTCNHNCVHCVVSDKKEQTSKQDFTFDEIVDMIDKYPDCNNFTITGGEPTLRKDLPKILKYIKDTHPGSFIDLQTNATGCANEEYAKSIVPYVDCFLVAIHNVDKVKHDHICQMEGAWDITLSGLMNILNNRHIGRFTICSQTVITKYNMNDLVDTADFLSDVGVDKITLTFPHAMGNALTGFYDVVPRYSAIEKPMYDILSKYGAKIMTSAFPPCYLRNYNYHIQFAVSEYNMASESYDRCLEIINGVENDYEPDDDFKIMIKDDFAKSNKCKECKFNKECLGVWKEYIQYYGDDDIIPIKE